MRKNPLRHTTVVYKAALRHSAPAVRRTFASARTAVSPAARATLSPRNRVRAVALTACVAAGASAVPLAVTTADGGPAKPETSTTQTTTAQGAQSGTTRTGAAEPAGAAKTSTAPATGTSDADKAAADKAAADKVAAEKAAAAKKAAEQRAAAERAAAASRGDSRHPVNGWAKPVDQYALSAGFAQSGARWSHKHSGQDFAVPMGTPVHAASAGTVVEAGWGGAYGNNIVVKHGPGRYSQYAHLSKFDVNVGDRVNVGEQIALSGNTGNSSGPHLHFEIRNTPVYGSAVEPLHFLRAQGVNA